MVTTSPTNPVVAAPPALSEIHPPAALVVLTGVIALTTVLAVPSMAIAANCAVPAPGAVPEGSKYTVQVEDAPPAVVARSDAKTIFQVVPSFEIGRAHV